ncbi:MAG TPA: hypothetical protein VJZ69_05340 [Clostridia bacterium]|nr:hypothetical protein [Clostridia bacterium]
MLQVIFTTEKEVLLPLYKRLLNSDKIAGANYVLREDGIAIGVCQLGITDLVEIKQFAIEKMQDNEGVADFFFRTVLFKLSFNPFVVRVGKVDDRLLKFGFCEDGLGGMNVLSQEIAFPSDCGH